MSPFKDILFDATKLVEFIEPAAWGQGFKKGRGMGISFKRVIECLQGARVQPDEHEGYVQETPREIFIDLVKLTLEKNPMCQSPAKLRETLANVYEVNGNHFSHGEKELIKALQNLVGDEDTFKFYLLFQDRLDPLLSQLTSTPKESIELVGDDS
jgi:hypothetical protein